MSGMHNSVSRRTAPTRNAGRRRAGTLTTAVVAGFVAIAGILVGRGLSGLARSRRRVPEPGEHRVARPRHGLAQPGGHRAASVLRLDLAPDRRAEDGWPFITKDNRRSRLYASSLNR